jgi:hypothetical protein
MRIKLRLAAIALLAPCVGACDSAAHADRAATPVALAPALPGAHAGAGPLATSAADAGLAIAIARESAARAALDQTLHEQRRLQEDEREHRQAREAAQRGNGSERCIAGQKMRRVSNGWVQAGSC